ncbi:predicted protein [Nematostella vectensis]|uniref:Thiopeptide-type bacteriocin biosynthesis domain-containing protein n=1 Tax=Nematostella vectensis TaxID=45351 RepID=A7TC26_NEMVE|nr:predicted protein [Nematostella vectensis]|eukprot:XP_001618517.1 hypothetical protein NEMVEDRAFT_v1g225053 [Nematostella vectensis]
MPLLQVLDVENGVGYPNKDTVGVNYLIDGMVIGNAQQDYEIKWTLLQKRLFELLLKSYKNDAKSIIISEEDFKDVDFTNANLPHSFAIKFNVLNAETEKIQLDAIAGATANLLIGRFGHGNAAIAEIINEITEHEELQANDSILAEIVHLPESRIGNILSRPEMRNYEMAYLAKSNKENQFQIKISDLYVSVRNGNIILRSKALNKQIIPRLVDGDNELLINSEEEIAILSFIDTIKNRSSINLEEFLFNTNQALIKDTAGNGYTNECVAILLNDSTKFPKINFDDKKEIAISRQFLPGSEWLYFKIYCGVKTSDYILTEVILPVIENFIEKGTIKKWFYLRYVDTDYHLRFRLHLTNPNEFDGVMNEINTALSSLHDNGLIAKVQLDTYNREIERYGADKIEATEELFFIDSMFCANFINYLDPEIGISIKWQIALRGTDQYLDDFGLDLEQKAAFTEKVAENFFFENKGDTFLRKQLNEKYRKMRSEVEDLMLLEKDAEREIAPLLELLSERSYANKTIAASLNVQYEDKEFHNLVFSYIHMMHNRIFNAKQRHNEFIIYELLSRHYKSFIARKKYEKIPV